MHTKNAQNISSFLRFTSRLIDDKILGQSLPHLQELPETDKLAGGEVFDPAKNPFWDVSPTCSEQDGRRRRKEIRISTIETK